MPWGTVAAGVAPAVIGHFLGNGGGGEQVQRTPAMTPEQEQLFEQLIQQMGEPVEPHPGQVEALELLRGMTPPAQVDPRVTEDYFREAIEEPATRHFREQILPGIGEQFAGPGTYWGGARARAQREAGEDLARTLTEQRAQLRHADEQARFQQQLAAQQAQMGLAGQMHEMAGAPWQQQMQQHQMAQALLGISPEHIYFHEPQPHPLAQILGQAGQLYAGHRARQDWADLMGR